MLSHTFEAPADVEGFVALVPSESNYAELHSRATGNRDLRPVNGLALLHMLRATPEGRAHAAAFGAEERQAQLRQIANEWLSLP